MNKRNLMVIGLAILGVVMILVAFFLMNNKNETITYQVTFDSKGGTVIEKQTINEGEKVVKPNDPTKDGYIFVEWQLDGKTYDFSLEVTKDLDLEAKWISVENTTEKFVVKFDSDGGTTISNQVVDKGSKVVKPNDPTREGYTFVEWQLDGKTYDFNSRVESNVELKAKWERNEYTVTFNSDGGTSVKKQTIYEGNKVTRPINPTREGYTFVEWQLDGESYDFNTKVTKDITLKAVWKEIKKYTVTFNSDGGTTVQSQTIYEGNKVTKPANPTREGYIFVEWQLDGKAFDFNAKVTKDITLKAVWKKLNSYTITFDSDGGTSVKNQTIYEGNKVTRPINPTREGYTFVEWQLDGESYDFNTKVTKEITLKAIWKEIKKYTVTFNSDGGTTIQSQTIYEGNKVTRPANPTREGYTFVEWQLDGKAYDFNAKVTKDITLKAVWKQKNYVVHADPVDQTSSFSKKLTVYEDGKIITVKTIQYSDGVVICSGDNPNVNYHSIKDESTLKLVLNNGSVVTASLIIN